MFQRKSDRSATCSRCTHGALNSSGCNLILTVQQCLQGLIAATVTTADVRQSADHQPTQLAGSQQEPSKDIHTWKWELFKHLAICLNRGMQILANSCACRAPSRSARSMHRCSSCGQADGCMQVQCWSNPNTLLCAYSYFWPQQDHHMCQCNPE